MVELGIVGVWPLCGSCVCVYVEADAERRRRAPAPTQSLAQVWDPPFNSSR